MDDRGESFEEFAQRWSQHLQEALVPIAGLEAAHDATSEALLYAWRHWERLRQLDNPEGYLYVLARRRALRRPKSSGPALPVPEPVGLPEVEPGLVAALAELTDMQRQVVCLVEAFGWRQTDVARLLDISVSTVRNHLARGLARLRSELNVESISDA